RRASADSMQSALWQTRAQFETRTAGGVNFFYRQDPESDREVAFAVTGDHLLLATREDLMAGALQLLAGDKVQSVEVEPWWTRSVAPAAATGLVRHGLSCTLCTSWPSSSATASVPKGAELGSRAIVSTLCWGRGS